MNLDAGQRKELADRILATLEKTAPGSEALLRGSLADKSADVYSDIDIVWEVPDPLFKSRVDNIKEILSKVHPIESLRSEPTFQNSKKRRLFFVRFRDIPLFWRLDLDVFARSIKGDEKYDLNNPNARGDDWSPAESALMNAIAAVKAHLRDKDDVARQLLERAYERVGLDCPDLQVRELILRLADNIKPTNPELRDLSGGIEDLVLEAF
jgi:predicted nucleotidyltransferase